MPTKDELLRLQEIYRTDKKIGEALGGVPEYLIAYWRRKKGIPKPSFAKYTETQVRELWERYGDDFHCGRELGISKAAFYSWRRRYNIKEKPQALKLEQLELRFGWETKLGSNGVYVEFYQTAYQKIMALAGKKQTVQPGEAVHVKPDLIILPAARFTQPNDPRLARKIWWVDCPGGLSNRAGGDQGDHILHSLAEVYYRGLIMPNQLIATSLPDAIALGAFSSAVVPIPPESIEAALDGTIDVAVPQIIKVTISGKMTRELSVVDLLGFYIQQLTGESFRGKMIEFTGLGVEKLSGPEKMELCAIMRMAGAESAFCLFDESTRRSLAPFVKVKDKILFSDKTAHYESEYLLNTVGLSNYIFRNCDLHSPCEVSEAEELSPAVIFIGGLCGGDAGTLKTLADLVRGDKIAKLCRCFISPASQRDLVTAIKKKSLLALAEFGCQILPVGMNLQAFLQSGSYSGKILSVPDFCPPDIYADEIIFASAQTAIRSAQAGKII